MEWTSCERNLLDGSEDCLGEEENIPIRVEWVSDL
jgi:hypothetical protein